MNGTQIRTYQAQDIVRFRKTADQFGGLSNMAPGFPIVVLEHSIRTSEALYQACRFPHMPDVQKMILNERSPMTAKMKSKPYRNDSRPDWDDVRVKVMKWCLRVKLINNRKTFSQLLFSTGDCPIVEDSRKDNFWGAMPGNDDTLTGQNVLGRLLMDLRQTLREDPKTLLCIAPLEIPKFYLLGQQIPMITLSDAKESLSEQRDDLGPTQPSLF